MNGSTLAQALQQVGHDPFREVRLMTSLAVESDARGEYGRAEMQYRLAEEWLEVWWSAREAALPLRGESREVFA